MTKFSRNQKLSDLFKKEKRVHLFTRISKNTYDRVENLRDKLSQEQGRKVSQSEITEVALKNLIEQRSVK